jgi:rubrerythrin
MKEADLIRAQSVLENRITNTDQSKEETRMRVLEELNAVPAEPLEELIEDWEGDGSQAHANDLRALIEQVLVDDSPPPDKEYQSCIVCGYATANDEVSREEPPNRCPECGARL